MNVNGDDVGDLVIELSTGSLLRGLVTFDQTGTANAPPPSSLEMTAIPVDLDMSPGRGGWA